MEGSGNLEGNGPLRAEGLGEAGGLLHSLPGTADDQLSRTVVVADADGSYGCCLRTGLLQLLLGEPQNGRHGTVHTGRGLRHFLPPEGHHFNGGFRRNRLGTGQGGILAQREACRKVGPDAHFLQNRCDAAGKGHHRGLCVAGLVDFSLRILKGKCLQVKVQLRLVINFPKGRILRIEIPAHARMLTALSCI